MVRNYIFGEPIETDAVVKEIASSAWCDGVFQKKEDGFHYSLKEDEIVYGLGENVRGINKRGWRYISNCSDNPNHCENTNSLYGAHNFIMVGDVVHETYGLFVDTQGRVQPWPIEYIIFAVMTQEKLPHRKELCLQSEQR